MVGQQPQYPPQPEQGPQGQAQGYQGQPYGGQQQPGQPQYGAQSQGYDPDAPYGYDRMGKPYSDKQKNLVGGLQLLPCIIAIGGIGRLYSGDIGVGIAQLVLSCTGIGQIWSIVDGIIVLVSDEALDNNGRPFRP